jgi:hypothetical protein
MRRLRVTVLLLGVVGLVSALLLTPIATAAPNRVSIPVTGTTPDGDTFSGTYSIKGFESQGGELVAITNLTGTITDSVTGVTTAVNLKNVAVPVNLQQSSGTCEILDLVLGPLHLDLLGLVIDLNQVHLTITAEQGEGNLLGNLLCAVAGLLDGTGSTNQLAQLLNQILSALLG